MQDLSPILEAARSVLTDMPGKQGHVKDIAEEAVRRHLNLGWSAEDFSIKVAQALAAHVKRKDVVFVKVAGKKDAKGNVLSYRKGVYRLKQVRQQNAHEVHAPPPVETGYMGRAGEHAVMSELLFWGFNASLMAVDQGIDIVASREGRYFHLQVKTSTQRADGRFSFSIKASSFDGNHNGTTYYVFLMRNRNSNVFAVLPSSHLEVQRRLGVIRDGESLSVVISVDAKGKVYTLNGRDNITPFINNFGQVR